MTCTQPEDKALCTMTCRSWPIYPIHQHQESPLSSRTSVLKSKNAAGPLFSCPFKEQEGS